MLTNIDISFTDFSKKSGDRTTVYNAMSYIEARYFLYGYGHASGASVHIDCMWGGVPSHIWGKNVRALLHRMEVMHECASGGEEPGGLTSDGDWSTL